MRLVIGSDETREIIDHGRGFRERGHDLLQNGPSLVIDRSVPREEGVGEGGVPFAMVQGDRQRGSAEPRIDGLEVGEDVEDLELRRGHPVEGSQGTRDDRGIGRLEPFPGGVEIVDLDEGVNEGVFEEAVAFAASEPSGEGADGAGFAHAPEGRGGGTGHGGIVAADDAGEGPGQRRVAFELDGPFGGLVRRDDLPGAGDGDGIAGGLAHSASDR